MKRLIQLVALLTGVAWCVPTSAAVTYVGSGAISATTTTTDATPSLPTGHTTDDVLFVYCWVRSTTDTMDVSGYTQVDQVDTGTGSHSLWWKRDGGSESNPTCNKSASADSYGVSFAFRGVVTSGDPWNAISDMVADNGTTDPTSFTGITTATASSMVFAVHGYEDNDASVAVVTSTDPSAYTEDYMESATGADGSIEIAYAVRTSAGATGDISIAYGTISARSDDMANIILSLEPAAGGGGGGGDSTLLACWGNAESSSTADTTSAVSVSPTGGTGHALVAFPRAGNGTAVSMTISDGSGSNSWSSLVSTVSNSDDSDQAAMSIALDVVGGTYTVTSTLSAGRGYRSLGVCEFDNVASASVLDTNASGQVPESSQQSSVTTGSFSTSNATDVLVLMSTYSCVSCTRSNGTIAGTSVSPNAMADDSTAYYTNVSSTVSSQTATAAAASNNGWVAILAALTRAAGGGGGTISTPTLMMQGVGD